MKNITTLGILLLTVLFVSESCADGFGTGGNTFNIDFVTIGNPGFSSQPGDAGYWAM